MKKSRFTETQIIAILTQAEKGMKVSDICREHGISQPTFYSWQRKYGGMSVAELKRLKELEKEVRDYKDLVADLSLQNKLLKEIVTKKD